MDLAHVMKIAVVYVDWNFLIAYGFAHWLLPLNEIRAFSPVASGSAERQAGNEP